VRFLTGLVKGAGGRHGQALPAASRARTVKVYFDARRRREILAVGAVTVAARNVRPACLAQTS
jgi:hypothetical protein